MVATVSLRAIAARTDLGLRLLAGTLADRMVRWVHVCELPDPALYLNGQELLLTAGVDFPVGDPEIDHYVARLVEADTAALGFGVTPSTTRCHRRLWTLVTGMGCHCWKSPSGSRSSTSARRSP
jgi:hypothetical protein